MLSKWRDSYKLKNVYCVKDRRPFYKVASEYLPFDRNAVIVDIGSGECEFADYLNLAGKYKNLFLLDANSAAIKNLNSKFKNAVLYKAPDSLPFENASVHYIHCSHLIEHLYPQELYQFLKEMDRVLRANGVLCISSPLFWNEFYSDLSHVRPYNHTVFMNYLCTETANRSRDAVSNRYSVLNLIYRYSISQFAEEAGAVSPLIDCIIYYARKFFKNLGLRKYIRNGYTLVLKKQ